MCVRDDAPQKFTARQRAHAQKSRPMFSDLVSNGAVFLGSVGPGRRSCLCACSQRVTVVDAINSCCGLLLFDGFFCVAVIRCFVDCVRVVSILRPVQFLNLAATLCDRLSANKSGETAPMTTTVKAESFYRSPIGREKRKTTNSTHKCRRATGRERERERETEQKTQNMSKQMFSCMLGLCTVRICVCTEKPAIKPRMIDGKMMQMKRKFQVYVLCVRVISSGRIWALLGRNVALAKEFTVFCGHSLPDLHSTFSTRADGGQVFTFDLVGAMPSK